MQLLATLQLPGLARAVALRKRPGPLASGVCLRQAALVHSFGTYYVYVLESKVDQKLYIGCTSDLKRRFQEHNTGLNQSTKSRGPFHIIYYEAFLSKDDAFAREKVMKGQWGRKFIQRTLKYYLAK